MGFDGLDISTFFGDLTMLLMKLVKPVFFRTLFEARSPMGSSSGFPGLMAPEPWSFGGLGGVFLSAVEKLIDCRKGGVSEGPPISGDPTSELEYVSGAGGARRVEFFEVSLSVSIVADGVEVGDGSSSTTTPVVGSKTPLSCW